MVKLDSAATTKIGELTVKRSLFAFAILASTALTSAAWAADTIKM